MRARCLPILLSLASFASRVLGQVPAAAASNAPPATPARTVVDGTKVIDAFPWIEDLKNPEVQSWFKARNDYTRSVLDRIPGAR